MFVPLFAALALGLPRTAAASQDERFLDGLRQQHLYGLAESFCRQQLAEDEVPDAARVRLTVEWIRTLSQHAAASAPTERDRLWKEAQDIALDFERQHPRIRKRILVKVQLGLGVLAMGELARQEAEVSAQPGPALERARQTVREAAGLFRQLEKEVEQRLPVVRRNPPPPGEMTVDELGTLLLSIRFQQSRAARNQALCYPADSADRVASLTQAIEQLEALVTQLAADDPLIWTVRIDLLACFRLLKDFNRARGLLTTFGRMAIPDEVRIRLQVETARLLLAAGQSPKAWEWLANIRTNKAVAELDFSRLEIAVARWKAAEKDEQTREVQTWQQQSVSLVKSIEETHGPYWGHRANLILVSAAGTGRPSTGDIDILMRTADNLYLKKQFDQAIANYERAAAAAQSSGSQDLAFELFSKAALIEQNRKQYDLASHRFRELSLSMRTLAKADRAHLLAVWNAGQFARLDTDGLNLYESLLSEHVSTWPNSNTADQARVWLGKLLQSRQQWDRAAAAFRGVRADHAAFPEAVKFAGASWLNWLAAEKAGGKPYDAIAQDGVQFFESLVMDESNQLPKTWTAVQLDAALFASQIRLRFTANGFAAAERLLDAAIQGSPESSIDWRSSAFSSLVVALAGQGRSDDAATRLNSLTGGSVDQLLAMLSGLSKVAERSSREVRAELSKLQLDTINLLSPRTGQLTAAQRRRVLRIRADALAVSGQRAAARDQYRSLARDNPKDGEMQEAYASFLLEGDDRESQTDALGEWRKIASRSKPASSRWFRARYSTALSMYRLGDRGGAAKLIRYLQATQDLAGSGLAAEFAELLKKCDS